MKQLMTIMTVLCLFQSGDSPREEQCLQRSRQARGCGRSPHLGPTRARGAHGSSHPAPCQVVSLWPKFRHLRSEMWVLAVVGSRCVRVFWGRRAWYMGWEGQPRRDGGVAPKDDDMAYRPHGCGWKRLAFLSARPVLETGGSVVVWALPQARTAS